jgi:hypothetical protein
VGNREADQREPVPFDDALRILVNTPPMPKKDEDEKDDKKADEPPRK